MLERSLCSLVRRSRLGPGGGCWSSFSLRSSLSGGLSTRSDFSRRVCRGIWTTNRKYATGSYHSCGERNLPAQPGRGCAVLVLDDVHAYYGQSHVLQGMSLTIEEGTIVSLLGRNG